MILFFSIRVYLYTRQDEIQIYTPFPDPYAD